MAEEIKEDIDSKEESLEVDMDDMPDSSGKKPDDGPGFVRKAMEKLGIGGKKDKEPEEELEKEIGEDIPDEFTKLALTSGWSEKDIVDFASDYSDDELKEMIPFLMEEAEKLEPDKPATQEETPKPQQPVLPKEGIEALKEEIRKELRGEIDLLKEKLSVVDKAAEAHQNQVMMDLVNKAFDEAGKEFEVFGQTKELPTFPAGPKKGQYIPTSPQVKARNEVWDMAYALIQSGKSTEDAMRKALTWYKGEYLASDVKRNLIKDLKKNETKLSAKRTSKKTTPVYEDEEERRKAFILQEAEKLGIKLPQE